MEREPGNEITFAREKACQIRKMISITCSYVVVSKSILDPSNGGFDNIRLADLLKINLGVEVYYKIENSPVFA